MISVLSEKQAMVINFLHSVSLIVMIAFSINLVSVNNAQADWRDLLNKVKSQIKPTSKGNLTTEEIIEGLKEALRVGTRKSIDVLGRHDGYFKDQSVKILMPKKLRNVEKMLRNFGQGRLADEFVETMNRAAEKSVQATFDIFVRAIQQMTLKDAMDIYKGREDEATRYFRNTQGQQIHNTILPIVRDATKKTGVTSHYKEIVGRFRSFNLPVDVELPDIDEYVTKKAMDGIFLKIAKEEAQIRKNPAARTTEILKKVFGQ